MFTLAGCWGALVLSGLPKACTARALRRWGCDQHPLRPLSCTGLHVELLVLLSAGELTWPGAAAERRRRAGRQPSPPSLLSSLPLPPPGRPLPSDAARHGAGPWSSLGWAECRLFLEDEVKAAERVRVALERTQSQEASEQWHHRSGNVPANLFGNLRSTLCLLAEGLLGSPLHLLDDRRVDSE